MTVDEIYVLQIAALSACIALFLACIVMTYKARLAINSLARSIVLLLVLLIALCGLLILRRLDSLWGLLDNTLGLTSVIVFVACCIAVVFTLDVYYLYRQRDFYAAWAKSRKEKEAALEAMREKEEHQRRRRDWDSDLPARWL